MVFKTTIEEAINIGCFLENKLKDIEGTISTIVNDLHHYFIKITSTKQKLKILSLDLIVKTSAVLRSGNFSVAADVCW